MSHSHSHSHSHGHTHDHGSGGGGGGHGHSHASSPYDRSCQSPTSAAVYGFVCAFVGALAAVSLPTHVTGYFLPSVPQTALLWCTVGSSAAYAGACVVGFFGVMEESVSAGFGRPRKVVMERDGTERMKGGDGEEEVEREWERRMRRLRWVSWVASGLLALTVALSVALFALALRYSLTEWTACAKEAIIHVETSAEEETHASAVQHVCEEMHLNQTYLVLGIPGLLVLLELFRSLKTAHFLALAADRPVVREYAALPRFSVRGTGEFDGDGLRARLRSVRELGKAPRGWRRERRREEREKRRRWSTSSGSGSDSEADERGLLSA